MYNRYLVYIFLHCCKLVVSPAVFTNVDSSVFPTVEDIFLHAGGGGSDVRVMSVRLPSVKQDQESVSLSSVEGDTDSSANEVY